MTKLDDVLPEKGKDLKVICSDNKTHYCFRCACPDDKCETFRDSISGSELLIDVIYWKYE